MDSEHSAQAMHPGSEKNPQRGPQESHDVRIHYGRTANDRIVVCFTCAHEKHPVHGNYGLNAGPMSPDAARAEKVKHLIQTTRQVYS